MPTKYRIMKNENKTKNSPVQIFAMIRRNDHFYNIQLGNCFKWYLKWNENIHCTNIFSVILFINRVFLFKKGIKSILWIICFSRKIRRKKTFVVIGLNFFKNRRKDFHLDIVIVWILYGYEREESLVFLYRLNCRWKMWNCFTSKTQD